MGKRLKSYGESLYALNFLCEENDFYSELKELAKQDVSVLKGLLNLQKLYRSDDPQLSGKEAKLAASVVLQKLYMENPRAAHYLGKLEWQPELVNWVGFLDQVGDQTMAQFLGIDSRDAIPVGSAGGLGDELGSDLGLQDQDLDTPMGDVAMDMDDTDGDDDLATALGDDEGMGGLEADNELVQALQDAKIPLPSSLQEWGFKKKVSSASDENMPYIDNGSIVLVVDDMKVNQILLTKVLENAGYKVLIANDGGEGLEMVQANPDIGCIVTDVEMPGMDGIEFVERLRSLDGEISRIPVIVASGNPSCDMEMDCYDAGGDVFLTKPFNLPEFKAEIAELLAPQRDAMKKEPAPPNQLPTKSEPTDTPDLPPPKQAAAHHTPQPTFDRRRT